MRWPARWLATNSSAAGRSCQVGRSTLPNPGCRLRLLPRDFREVDPGFGPRRVEVRSLLVLQEAPDPAILGQTFVSPPVRKSLQERAPPFWIRMSAVSLRVA